MNIHMNEKANSVAAAADNHFFCEKQARCMLPILKF